VAATRVIELRTVLIPLCEVLERERRAVARPLIVHEPIVAAEAREATVTDVDGNTFVVSSAASVSRTWSQPSAGCRRDR
jgi:hypothetical protein